MTFGDASGLFYALSPALIGSLAGACVGLFRFQGVKGIPLLLSGVGGIVGYLTIAFLIRVLDAFGVYVFTPERLVILSALVAITGLIFVKLLVKDRVDFYTDILRSFRGKSSLLILFCALGLLIVQSLFQAAMSPVASWDGLGLWTGWGNWFLQFDSDFQDAKRGWTRAELGVFPLTHPRHPPTIYHLAAFSGYALEKAEVIRGWLVPWSAIWLCGVAILWGLVISVSGSASIATLAAIGFCSLPLLENHAILVGYADLVLVMVILASSAMISLALYRQSPALMCFAVVLAMMPIGLKNTGLLYATALLAPLVVLAGLKRSPHIMVALVCISCAALYWLLATGFDVRIFNQRYSLFWGTEAQIIMGGYKMEFSLYPVSAILRNQFWALFLNQSFSVSVLLGLVMSALFFGSRSDMKDSEKEAIKYLLLLAVILLLAFMVPQLVSDYATRFAEPSSDLGNSRFIMAFGPVILLAFGFAPNMLRGCQSPA